LSAALPWLRVTGNQITTVGGAPVFLRGVSLLGMDHAAPHVDKGFAAGAGITEQTIDEILAWGANVIRIAINRTRVISGSGGFSAWNYLEDLQWIVARAAAGGAYTMLALRRLDDSTIFGTVPGSGIPNWIAPHPDYDSIGMWRLLGEYFAAEPAVLYDLYPAPHAALPDDITGFDSDWNRWIVWNDMTIAELRGQNPRALCVVSGMNWGTDVSAFPLIGTSLLPIPNVVYGIRHFPGKGVRWPAVRRLAYRHPVFVTEWGGGDSDAFWGAYTAQSLRAEGIGWTAAHWIGETPLTQRIQNRLTPTLFGNVVRHALAVSGERNDATSTPLTPSSTIPPLPGGPFERSRFY
jgi:hypothetical protein